MLTLSAGNHGRGALVVLGQTSRGAFVRPAVYGDVGPISELESASVRGHLDHHGRQATLQVGQVVQELASLQEYPGNHHQPSKLESDRLTCLDLL